MRRTLALTVLVVASMIAALVVSDSTVPDGAGTRRVGAADDGRATPRPVLAAAGLGLEGFDACDQLLDHMRDVTRRQDMMVRLTGFEATDAGGLARDQMAEAADGADGADGGAGGGVTGTSGTNVQVAGVDELDLVETDGRRVFTVHDGRLHVVDVTVGAPREHTSVDLDVAGGLEAELLLHEDRLLVVLRGGSDALADATRDMLAPGPQATTAILFDVADAQPVEVARVEVDGALVAGRGIDGTAHLVLAHRPNPIPLSTLDEVWSTPDPVTRTRRIEEALRATGVEDWLPATTHVAPDGTRTETLLPCEDVVRPVGGDQAGMLQVVTLDTHDEDARPEATTAVLTDARSVTATADELVVATSAFAPDGEATRLHLFSLGPDGATHRASGEVPGHLLDQFSMSLHDGDLRVATTAGEAWGGGSESGVTVLRAEADRLEVVGSVGGLGRGETIHAVRFLGDRGYVVTFRQTDPLYSLDLSDPTAPAVTGELKITGYSAYLHPLGDGRLLGVGQEATTEGQVTGTQASVFDVSDPADPRRLSRAHLPGATSEAEWDHHAVLVHDDLVVLPVQWWQQPTPQRPDGQRSAAVVLGNDDGRLSVRGMIEETGEDRQPWQSAVRRALVVDGQLVTVSGSAVAVHDPTTLATAWRLPL